MIAYKFRTAHNFDFVVDIVINKRLFCSDARALNDIREADIRMGIDSGRESEAMQFANEVNNALNRYRVCSLCQTFDNHLLWAYYAAGSTGLAIEVEIPDDDVIHVDYDDNTVFLSDYLDQRDAEAAARASLSRKYSVWSHEQEVRIVKNDSYYNLSTPISKIIVGSRMSRSMVSALYLICSPYGIQLDRAVVSDAGIEAYSVPPIVLS